MTDLQPKVIEAAMKIILDAGDARQENLLAIESLVSFDIEQAEAYLEKAKKKITSAHKAQTDQIQEETRGKKSEYSLLFAHAQDTMMTINSEILLIDSLLKVFDSYSRKIQSLENKIEELSRND
ncbi:PTS lactose/cellobiose transporter subunit IIA [Niallia circulans]|uniref:PTS lactose/cellobiose transporter subunit IIA n=1 Tax=Niallia circulans TaxID=1397 RepID=UPI00352EEA2C